MNLRHLIALFVTGIGVLPAAAGDLPGKGDTGPQIAFELRVVAVPAEPGAVLNGTSAEEGGVTFLSDAQLKTLLTDVQADRRANVLQAPKVTTRDTKPATVRIVDRREFVTGLEVSHVNGAVVLVPRQTTVDLGLALTLCGRVSADRRRVAVAVQYTSTHLASQMVPLIPVTTPLAPAGGGQPVPFTQYLQAPDVRTITVEKAGLVLPSGGHAVITGPVTEVEERVTVRTPVLSDLPVLGRMFTSVGYGKRPVRTLVIVSARLLDSNVDHPVAPLPREVDR